jgi:hypothetical protein
MSLQHNSLHVLRLLLRKYVLLTMDSPTESHSGTHHVCNVEPDCLPNLSIR